MKPTQYEILLPTVFNQAFDYLAPDDVELNIGDIVSVPFGKQELLGVAGYAPHKTSACVSSLRV